MEPQLFSDLIKKIKIKPDSSITNKIDEIDFPFKHIKFIKKDINNFLFQSFSNIVSTHIDLTKNEKDLFNDIDSYKNILIELNNGQYNLLAKKIKKECNCFEKKEFPKFEISVLTDEFIDEINKFYILISLVFGIALDESFNFIKHNKECFNLNYRFINNEILGFWVNNYKNDFCYFDEINLDQNSEVIIPQSEIEFAIIQFYFNYYRKNIIDISNFKGVEYEILNSLLTDKFSYKWFVIFGTAIWEKIKYKFKNEQESILEGTNRLKNANYQFLNKIMDDLVNN